MVLAGSSSLGQALRRAGRSARLIGNKKLFLLLRASSNHNCDNSDQNSDKGEHGADRHDDVQSEEFVVGHEVDFELVDFRLADRFDAVFFEQNRSFRHESRFEFRHDFFVVWSELGVTADSVGSGTDGVLVVAFFFVGVAQVDFAVHVDVARARLPLEHVELEARVVSDAVFHHHD